MEQIKLVKYITFSFSPPRNKVSHHSYVTCVWCPVCPYIQKKTAVLTAFYGLLEDYSHYALLNTQKSLDAIINYINLYRYI